MTGDRGGSMAPPWVLFCDHGRPVAILPAGRPGEVANIEGLTMEAARAIVSAANAAAWDAERGRLEALVDNIERLTADMKLAAEEPTTCETCRAFYGRDYQGVCMCDAGTADDGKESIDS